MVDEEEVKKVTLNREAILSCIRYAGKSAKGGSSEAREGEQRADYLGEDQLSGQFCEAALSLFLFNSLDQFSRHQDECNQRRTDDYDYVFRGHKVDAKGTIMRSAWDWGSATNLNLIIMGTDARPGMIFVLGVIPFNATTVQDSMYLTAHLVGWEFGDQIPENSRWGPGKCGKEAWFLRPMDELLAIGMKAAV